MMKTIQSNQSSNRLAWLWLVLGVALLPFTSLEPSIPIAAWLAPVFLQRFTRMQRPRDGLFVLILVTVTSMALYPVLIQEKQKCLDI